MRSMVRFHAFTIRLLVKAVVLIALKKMGFDLTKYYERKRRNRTGQTPAEE